MPRISQLPALTVPEANDEIAIVDASAATTKKITRSDFLKGADLPNNTVTTNSIQDGAVTAGKLDLATYTDANGWTVYDYGNWKEYSMQTARVVSAGSAGTGNSGSSIAPPVGKLYTDFSGVRISPYMGAGGVQNVLIWPRIVSTTELFISYSRISTTPSNLDYTVSILLKE